MAKIRIFPPLLLLATLVVGCSGNADVRAVKKSFEALKMAILQDNVTEAATLAPILSEVPSEMAPVLFAKLKEGLKDAQVASVKILDGDNAVLELKGRDNAVLPFKKKADGAWVLSNTFTQKKTIEVVPRR